MTGPTPHRTLVKVLALVIVTVLGWNFLTLQARGNRQGQRPNPAFPHQDAPAPAVLALSIQGEPTLVGPSAPIPVVVPTPLAVTAASPLDVNDGSQAIRTAGDYTLIFASPVTLPKTTQAVHSIDVRVLQINGRWINTEYRTSQGVARMVFNTQSLLGFTTPR